MKTGAGSTVSVAELSGNKLRTYHAGDSLILLTTNHGSVKYLVTLSFANWLRANMRRA